MNKSNLIKVLAVKNNLRKEHAATIVDLVFNGFKETLKKGGRIEIRGFGSFIVRKYKAYEGRNPLTGKAVAVKLKRLPYFKVGRELREMVNEIKKG